MKTIYIHVGPHKTGTTTIQESLYAEQEKLRGGGVLVPAIGQPFPNNAGHHNLAWELLGDNHFSSASGSWDDLLELMEKTPQETIILTSEEFSRVRKEGIEMLQKKMANYDLRIVVYLRRQDKLMQSFWAEMLKSGNHPEFSYSFDKWLEKVDYQFKNANYQRVISRWSKAFGKEKMILRVLEPGQLQGALFHDFLATCGVKEPTKYALHKDTNISPGIKELVLIRELKRRLFKKLDERTANKFYFWARRYAEKNGWNEQKVNLIDASLYEKMMEFYKESNHAVAREYFGREELFLEPFKEKEITRFSAEDFTPQELVGFFGFVIGKMMKGRNNN